MMKAERYTLSMPNSKYLEDSTFREDNKRLPAKSQRPIRCITGSR